VGFLRGKEGGVCKKRQCWEGLRSPARILSAGKGGGGGLLDSGSGRSQEDIMEEGLI